jgi:predicted permease
MRDTQQISVISFDIPFTLMYCFFAILCVKISLSVGIIAYFKKIYSRPALRGLSNIIINYFYPIYTIIEISKMATRTNFDVFWILILSVIVSCLIGFISGWLFIYFFKLDIRISNSFSLICSLPSIGTIPLVISKAFCYPGGPLESDTEQCPNIIGYMLINFLVFQILLFAVSFFYMGKDANYTYELTDKMSISWHVICDKVYKKNYYILHTFKKYFSDKNLAKKKFEEFEANNKLVKNEGDITYEFVCYDDDDGRVENVNYYKELRSSQNLKPIIYEANLEERRMQSIKNIQREKEKSAKFQMRAKEQENPEEEDIDYIQQFIEPIKEKKEEYSYRDLKRDSSLRLQPKIQYEKDIKDKEKEKTINETSPNEIDDENISEKESEDNKKKGGYFESEYSSKKSESMKISDLNKDFKSAHPEDIHLENIEIVKGSESFDTYDSKNNPKIKKISPLIIEEVSSLVTEEAIRGKIRPSAAASSGGFTIQRKVQSEFFQPKKIKRENSISFAINKADKFGYSMLPTQQEKKVHQNIQDFLFHKRESFIIRPQIKEPLEVFIPRESMAHIKVTKEEKKFEKQMRESMIFENEKIITQRIQKHQEKFSSNISRYYQKMFKIIELNLNHEMKDEFLVEKSEVMMNVHDIPPKFPIVHGLEINRINIKEINAIWNDYYIQLKEFDKDFELHPNIIQADFSLILNKILSPCITSAFIGLMLGISDIRNIIFSSNHYITNVLDGVYIITKALVPLLYISVGFSFMSITGLSLDIPVSKKMLAAAFIVRFVVVPLFGLLWCYIFTYYYGGIIWTSKVFRISLYIPFAVPSTANLIIITIIMKFFIAESNLILVSQNLFVIITLTLWYLIYFLVVGAVGGTGVPPPK